ncbi:MAG: hypothetical protein Q8L55_15825, partial [Phycisphaerales bacterium]|nr:hypothetical protein [Phycisphaerales bacterium]
MIVPALAVAAGTSLTHAQCTGFAINSSSGATIVPGTTSVGNNGDDVVSTVALPFSVSLYGASYNSMVVSSNGNMQFTGSSTAYSNACLPAGVLGVTLAPHWDDLRTDNAGGGIFTSVSGVAPNRVFNVEWRAVYYNANTTPANFQVRLFEDNSHFEFIYGSNSQSGSSATVGVQNGGTTANQFSCSTGGLSSGLMLSFTPINSTTVLCSSGAVLPAGVNNCSASSTLVTVTVTPGTSPASTGIAVTGNLSNIGGPASQQFYDDGTHGDQVAGNNVFSYLAPVPTSVTPGAKSIAFSVSDQQGRSGTGSTSVTVNCVTSPSPLLGPDVYTYNITDVPRWGTNPAGDITAYSVGTTSSNEGDYPVIWIDSNSYLPDFEITQHPVISQNMYRL